MNISRNQRQFHRGNIHRNIEVISENVRINSPTIGLALLITSYFYSLPIGRYSFLGIGTDFRIYDFAFIGFILFFGLRYLKRISQLQKERKGVHYWIILLIILVWLSLSITAFVGKTPTTFFAAVLRAFRFTSYLLVCSFIVAIVDTPKQQKFLLGILYLNVSLQAGLAFGQGINRLPNFWPSYWLVGYGGDFPVATLSPHHLQIAVVMMIGLALAIFFFQQSQFLYGKLFHVGLAAIMVAVIVFSGTRTVWFSVPIMILAYIYIHRLRGLLVFALFALVAGTVIYYGWDYIRDPVQLQIETRVTTEIRIGGIYELFSDRASIYGSNFWERLLNRPWVLIIGSGFQNVAFFLGATGAHNNYLQAWFELGLIGLFIYLRFLKSITNSLVDIAQNSLNRYEMLLSKNTWALFIGILATMLASETLWAQYSTFALTGQIMALMGISISARNWTLDKSVHDEIHPQNFGNR